MRVLVATRETQGRRKNDFSFADEGELVGFTFECDKGTVDDKCGCRRSLVGFESRKGTTTFKCVEMPDMTPEMMRSKLHKSREDGDWLRGMPEADIAEWIDSEAEELMRLAAIFPAGTIIEKRGDMLRQRLTPA